MKICLITTLNQKENAHIYLKHAKTLKKQGHDIYILCPDCSGEDENGINFVTVKLPKIKLFRKLFLKLKMMRAALKQRAAVYHVYGHDLLKTGAGLAKRRKKVVFDVCEDENTLLFPLSGKERERFERVQKKLIPLFNAVICTTDASFEQISLINERSIVIHDYPHSESFKGFVFNRRKNTIIFVGEASEEAGFTKILSAVSNSNRQTLLVHAGGYSSRAFHEEIKKSDSNSNLQEFDITQPNWRSELYMSACMAICPPANERMCDDTIFLQALEYMLAGIPILCDENANFADLITQGGCGCVTNFNDENEIKQTLEYLLVRDDILTEMGKSGKKAVTSKYTWEIEGKKLGALYDVILGRHHNVEDSFWHFEGGVHVQL